MKTFGKTTLAMLASTALLSACGSDGGGELSITDGWARTSPSVASTAAFYMQIENGTDAAETVAAATSDRCGMTEVHNSSMNDEGVMSMAPADPADLTVDAGGTLLLQPGGLHVMCMGLSDALVEGEEIPVAIMFGSGAEQSATVVVREP